MIPGVDYVAPVPPMWSDMWDVLHMIVKTDAPQPKTSYVHPQLLDGYQVFNVQHEYGREELFVGDYAYVGSLRANRRRMMFDELEALFDARAQQWHRDKISFEMPDVIWLFTSERPEPIPFRIGVVDAADPAWRHSPQNGLLPASHPE